METLTTKGIKISVNVRYQPSHSKPLENKYIFAYQITIENKSEDTVQLLRRHWHIFDSSGLHREVAGDGVIGKQPTLRPGQSHRYTSGSRLFSDIGKMRGTYTMLQKSNQMEFEVIVPEFRLVIPSKLN